MKNLKKCDQKIQKSTFQPLSNLKSGFALIITLYTKLLSYLKNEFS